MAVRVAAPGREGARALFERSEQLATLAHLRETASGGLGQLALVRGEAGAGKTALLRAFLGELPDDAESAIGYCDGIATPRPLSPIHDLARALGNGLSTLLQRSASREEIRDHLLQRYQRDPVVLAIEDIQWADDATIDLIRQLARRIDETSALLLLTYREEPHAPVGMTRLLGQLATSPSARQVDVPPLSRAAVAAMAAGSSINPDELYRLTSGNPFFASEMLASHETNVPPSIRDLIRSRIAELDERAHAALEAAAILGSRTEPWLLAAVAGEALPGIDDAIAVGLVLQDADGISFRHELARVAVLEDLPAIRAIGLHRSVLGALRRAGVTDSARLAHHADGAADGAAVLEFAPLAARQAIDNGALRAGIAQLQRSLRFATQPNELRAELLEQLGDAEIVIANGIEADDAWMEALALRRATGDDPRQVGDLMRRIARSAMWRADFPRAMALATEAVAKLEPLGESHQLAMAYAGFSAQLFIEAHSEEAITWGERALAMAERIDDDEARVHAFNNIGCAEAQLGREGGVAKLERSLALARATGDWFSVYRALFNLASSASAFQQLHRAEAAFDELARFSAGTEVLSCNIDANRAEILLGLGRWEEAEAAARSALNVVDGSLDPLDASIANAVLGRLMARGGDPGAAAFAQRALELVSQTHDLYRTWLALVPSLEVAWLDDDLPRLLPKMQGLLDAAAEHRDPWVTAEIARWVRRAGGILPDLPNLAGPHQLALAADWRAAAADWRERDNLYESALALLEGDDPSAVREAHDILAVLGAPSVARKAAERLRQMGAPVPRGPRQSTAANAAGLTEREAEIAELVAAGLSNHEIAERLVLSDKTVGHHVSAILGKLGVRRRAEVAARLAAEGAAPR